MGEDGLPNTCCVSLVCSFLPLYPLKEDFPQVCHWPSLSAVSSWGISTTMTSILILCDCHICNSNTNIFLEILPLDSSCLLDISVKMSHKLGQRCTTFCGPFIQNEMRLCNVTALPNISYSARPKRNSESPEYYPPTASPSDLISINAILRVIFSANFPFLRNCVLIFSH